MAEEVTLEEVLNFENTLLAELKAMAGIDTEITLDDVNQLYKANIILLLRAIKEQGIGTGTGGTGLTTTQSNALSSLITALNANKVLSDNNYTDEEQNKVTDSFQKASNTSDDILEGITHLFVTADERDKISNAFLLTENTDVLTEGNMNLFVTPAEKSKWNGNRTVYPVANIAERNALITNPLAGVTVQAGDKSFVLDDGDGKYAEYTYTGSAWLKTGDPDWANVVTEWANIANKPTTVAGYGITDAVTTAGGQTINGNLTATGLITGSTLKGTWGTFLADVIIGTSATSITGYKVNLYGGIASSLFKYTNATTGQTATDGLDIGITTDGTAEIRQRENMPLNMYINNTLVKTCNVDGSIIHKNLFRDNKVMSGIANSSFAKVLTLTGATAGYGANSAKITLNKNSYDNQKGLVEINLSSSNRQSTVSAIATSLGTIPNNDNGFRIIRNGHTIDIYVSKSTGYTDLLLQATVESVGYTITWGSLTDTAVGAGTEIIASSKINGSVVLGEEIVNTTTATDNFVYIPTVAGTPTGIPTSYTGKAAMEFDTTGNKLWIYNGGWKSIQLA